MTVEAGTSSSAESTDEALLAELTPQMLAKLKMDSRMHGVQTGGLLVLAGTGSAQAFAKPFDGYLALLISAFGVAVGIFGAVIALRSLLRIPPALRDELNYRRQHGKWRWEH